MSTLIDDLIKGTSYESRFLREKRQKILIAFDKYKTNVQYGIEEETPIQHYEIMVWYQDMLDLKAEAFDNIPERVKYYL